MARRRRRKTLAAPRLFPRAATMPDGSMRDSKGRPLKRGRRVKIQPHRNAKLGTTVPATTGVYVTDLYVDHRGLEVVELSTRDRTLKRHARPEHCTVQYGETAAERTRRAVRKRRKSK